MGYEIKLIIGKESSVVYDEYAKGEPVLADGEVYYPYLKDADGDLIPTGRKETYFAVFATIDLCKCGYDSAINSIDNWNTDESHGWYWYEGSAELRKDLYGVRLKPVSISTIINALEKDMESSDYRRFKWALALLESMVDDEEELGVLIYKH